MGTSGISNPSSWIALFITYTGVGKEELRNQSSIQTEREEWMSKKQTPITFLLWRSKIPSPPSPTPLIFLVQTQSNEPKYKVSQGLHTLIQHLKSSISSSLLKEKKKKGMA